MEEKKIDINTIIGFVLIFVVLLYMMYINQPTPEELEAQKTEAASKNNTRSTNAQNNQTALTTAADYKNQNNDSLKQIERRNKFGAFANATSNQDETIVETDIFYLKFKNKGGFLSEVQLKEFVNYKNIPIYLIKDGNAAFNISFKTDDNRILNTKDLPFYSKVSTNGANTIVSLKSKVSDTQYLEYLYEFKPKDYMFNFNITSKGLKDVIDTNNSINLNWKLKTLRHDKSISYENRYTEVVYNYEESKDSYVGQSQDEETVDKLDWVGYKQHFFASVILPQTPKNGVELKSKNLVKDEAKDTLYTKQFEAKLPLTVKEGEIAENMTMYLGPSDFEILNKYNKNLDEIVPLGWGIFGWINKYLFIPLFGFLSGFLPYGIAIVVMTILIKILLSFVQYKQFLSQAKLKILKPELDAIRQKYKNNKLKAQQETMALQTRAGASPLSGCLPGLMQIPVFYALFQFFPSAFDLRQKSFLWADDLSSYDSVATLPFNVPFYGDHVSLFPILAAIAIFFYMKMTTGDNSAMQAPPQEGMPDMSKIMKLMIYLSPILMLVFFNNYASGLSLYYFISNLISIGIMLVIKNYIIDEEKVLQKIEVSKSKPQKENRFQRKMKEMMEQAEQQKQAQQKRGKR